MSVTRGSSEGRGEFPSKPGARRKGQENAMLGRPRGWRRGGVWRTGARGAEPELPQPRTRAPGGVRGVLAGHVGTHLKVVSKLTGAIGLVWAKKLLQSVKVLKVDRKRPGEPGYPLRM